MITTWGFGAHGGLVSVMGWGGGGAVVYPPLSIGCRPRIVGSLNLRPSLIDSDGLKPRIVGSGRKCGKGR